MTDACRRLQLVLCILRRVAREDRIRQRYGGCVGVEKDDVSVVLRGDTVCDGSESGRKREQDGQALARIRRSVAAEADVPQSVLV